MKRTRSAVFNLALSALFAALTAVLAQVSIYIFDIPFTASLIGVMLCGLILSPSYALLSMLCYIALGAAGIPVFAGFNGGAAHLLLPTGGFIFSYPIMAVLISYLSRKTKIPSSVTCMISLPICYILGSSWFIISGGKSLKIALINTVIPFIPFDVIKCLIASYINNRFKSIQKSRQNN